jgi:hypothetical protein
LTFVLAPDDVEDPTPPLARLIQGGRGGEVRMRLYLTIAMMATRWPYDIKSAPNPSVWAELLALSPETGPRRVSSNLKWLRNNSYIGLEPRPGRPARILLLDPGLSGAPYVRPAEQPGVTHYLGVPFELWRNGWILALSPTALALLLVLIEHQGGYGKNGKQAARYVIRQRRERYGLSPDTWTLARKELEKHGLLTVGRTPQGSDFDNRRMRNTYWVDLGVLKSTSPWSAPHQTLDQPAVLPTPPPPPFPPFPPLQPPPSFAPPPAAPPPAALQR